MIYLSQPFYRNTSSYILITIERNNTKQQQLELLLSCLQWMQLFKNMSAKIGSFIYELDKNIYYQGSTGNCLLLSIFICLYSDKKIRLNFYPLVIAILYYKTPIVLFLKIAIYISLKLF